MKARILCLAAAMAACDPGELDIAEGQQALVATEDGGTASGPATSTGGGGDTSATTTSTGAGGAPAKLGLNCNDSVEATAQHDRTLSKVGGGESKEEALADCEARLDWSSEYLECGCSAAQRKPFVDAANEYDPNVSVGTGCRQSFGLQVETTEACGNCTKVGNVWGYYWTCYAKGRISIGQNFECLSCQLTRARFDCGEIGKMPPGVKEEVYSGASGATKEEAAANCDTANYRFPYGCLSSQPGLPETPRILPGTSVENKQGKHCYKKKDGAWYCECVGTIKEGAEIDCKHCAHVRPKK